MSCIQAAASRGTSWTDMKVRKVNTLIIQAIDVWRFENGIAMTFQITIPLIVGENKDDVGLLVHEIMPVMN